MDWHNLMQGIPPWVLLVGGAALGWLKNFWSFFYNHTFGYVVRKLHVSITIEEQETEQAYMWVSLWAEKRIREKRITDLLLRHKHTPDGITYMAVPHYGTYYLRFRQRYLLVFTSSKEGQAPGADAQIKMSFMKPRRTVTIAVWGTLDRKVITDLLDDARDEYMRQLEKRLVIRRNESSWWEDRELAPRQLSTIYLPNRVVDSVVHDVTKFLAVKEKYKMLGIPWRMGLLFYGPPGTGKTSFVQAIATQFELPLYYLNLNTIEEPEYLARLINYVAPNSILLIEDVDCIPAARHRTVESSDPEKGRKGIIASDLLNVIDGVVATEGRILILTTNHRDRLDSALLRKGRIDREIEIDFAQDEELLRFHQRASEVFNIPDFDEFRSVLPYTATIADAQALLLGKEKETVLEGSNRKSLLDGFVEEQGTYQGEVSSATPN